MKITEISIKRTTIPVVVFTILTLVGIYSYTKLNVELVPKIDVPINVVMTVYPGAAPGEVESSVTKPIEDAVSGMEGIDNITSYSLENVSIVMITLKDDMNADIALQDCQRKVEAILSNLPNDIDQPQYMKMDMNMFPIMSIATSSDLPEKEFYDLIDLLIFLFGGFLEILRIHTQLLHQFQRGIIAELFIAVIHGSGLDDDG